MPEEYVYDWVGDREVAARIRGGWTVVLDENGCEIRDDNGNVNWEAVFHAVGESEGNKLKKIEDKSKRLLLKNLTKAQKIVFKQTETIPVVGKSGKRYRITKRSAYGVEVLDKKGKLTHKMCFQLDSSKNCPIYDQMLAQKLVLEADEKKAWKVANVQKVEKRQEHSDTHVNYAAQLDEILGIMWRNARCRLDDCIMTRVFGEDS